MGFNPAAEMSQLRTQRTLAMQATGPAAAAAAPTTVAGAAAAAPADGAAATGAAGDAAMGAMAVQEPPSTSKIVLQSVLKGAMTGASVSLGFKQFGPLLGKIPFVANMFGKLPIAGAVGTGLLGFVSKIPVLGGLVGKVAPLLAKTGLQGFLIAGLVGAGIGAIFGAVGGMKKAKAATAEYEEAMAAQQANAEPPVGDPVNTPAPPVDTGPAKPRFKNWIVAYQGDTKKPGGSTGTYKARKGDTLAVLAKRFHTTPAEIKKLNPGVGSKIEPGTTLKFKRKVIKKAA
jgi:LysM repeat protein